MFCRHVPWGCVCACNHTYIPWQPFGRSMEGTDYPHFSPTIQQRLKTNPYSFFSTDFKSAFALAAIGLLKHDSVLIGHFYPFKAKGVIWFPCVCLASTPGTAGLFPTGRLLSPRTGRCIYRRRFGHQTLSLAEFSARCWHCCFPKDFR